MNNISDIILKLPPILGVSIETTRKIPTLYSIKDITFHLQMCYYWLKAAKLEMQAVTGTQNLVGSNGDVEHKVIIPTLLGVPEQMEFMKKSLENLTAETWDYIDNVPLPAPVRYKLERSYDNMSMALFNVELSTTYYEQLTTARGY